MQAFGAQNFWKLIGIVAGDQRSTHFHSLVNAQLQGLPTVLPECHPENRYGCNIAHYTQKVNGSTYAAPADKYEQRNL